MLRLIQWIITRRQNARVTFSGDVTTSLTVDDEPPLTGIPSGENALIVSNHVAWSDFYLVHALAERMKMLSFTKYYVKVVWSVCLLTAYVQLG